MIYALSANLIYGLYRSQQRTGFSFTQKVMEQPRVSVDTLFEDLIASGYNALERSVNPGLGGAIDVRV